MDRALKENGVPKDKDNYWRSYMSAVLHDPAKSEHLHRDVRAILAQDPRAVELMDALGITDGQTETGPVAGDEGTGADEVSFNDPWPPDHPLRKESDEFLDILQQTFNEVLEEKGLSAKVGDSLTLSKSKMEDIRRAVADKLSFNHRAVQLMTMLQVDFTSDGLTGAKTAEQMRDELDPTALMTGAGGTHNYLLELRERRLYEELGPEAYKDFTAMRNRKSPYIPGLGDFAIVRDPSSMGDIGKYEIYVARIHDEVLSELGLDPATVRAGSPEAVKALRMIGERIMADPEGQQFIEKLGLTSVNQWGMPTMSADEHGPIYHPIFETKNSQDTEAGSSAAGEDETETDTAGEEPETVHWRDLMASVSAEQLAMSLRLMGLTSLDQLKV
jgi:hypothetical protein